MIKRLTASAKLEYPNALTPETSEEEEGGGMFPAARESALATKVLLEFKTKKCVKEVCGSKTNCWFYHGVHDQRRVITFTATHGFSYREFPKEGRGWSLRNLASMNHFEQQFHPLVYKTRPCYRYPECSMVYCAFAHGDAEVRRPDLWYRWERVKKTADKNEDSLLQTELDGAEREKAQLEQDLKHYSIRRKLMEMKTLCVLCREARWIGVMPCCGRVVCHSCSKAAMRQCSGCQSTGREVVIMHSND